MICLSRGAKHLRCQYGTYLRTIPECNEKIWSVNLNLSPYAVDRRMHGWHEHSASRGSCKSCCIAQYTCVSSCDDSGRNPRGLRHATAAKPCGRPADRDDKAAQ